MSDLRVLLVMRLLQCVALAAIRFISYTPYTSCNIPKVGGILTMISISYEVGSAFAV